MRISPLMIRFVGADAAVYRKVATHSHRGACIHICSRSIDPDATLRSHNNPRFRCGVVATKAQLGEADEIA
jgi:hypothetical protein